MPILTVVIVLSVIFTVALKMHSKSYGTELEEYINHEIDANAVKSKPIADGDFFVPDMSAFPIMPDQGEDLPVLRRQRDVINRAGKKMMRFDKPMSNTELKLKYGTVNLEKITEYEENFYQFTYAINNWAEALLEKNDEIAAEKVLRAGVLCRTETSKTYTVLADIYFKQRRRTALQELYDTVNNRNMPAKEKTWRYLNDLLIKMGS